MEIIEDPHFNEFINSRPIRDSTKKQYTLRIKDYCNFLNKTPTELIEEAEKEEDEKIRQKKRKIKRYFSEYHQKLIDEQKSPNYVKATIMTIRTFYAEFEIELPKNRIKQITQKRIITTDDIVGKEHILRALEHCNIRYKAIILLMSSSGMGRAEIINLTYNDFLDSISEYYKPIEKEQFDIFTLLKNLEEDINDIIPVWQIKRHKTNMPFVTFSSPESIQAIFYYLLNRIKQNKPIKSLNDSLFESEGHQIEESSVVKYFAKLNDACDFGFVGPHRFFTSHKLRKYFASTLNTKNVPEISTHWMLGHSIDKVTDAYFKLDIHALKEQYKRVVEDLSIEKVITREINTEEYEYLVQELQKVREESAEEKANILETVDKKFGWFYKALEKDEKLRKIVEPYMPDNK